MYDKIHHKKKKRQLRYHLYGKSAFNDQALSSVLSWPITYNSKDVISYSNP